MRFSIVCDGLHLVQIVVFEHPRGAIFGFGMCPRMAHKGLTINRKDFMPRVMQKHNYNNVIISILPVLSLLLLLALLTFPSFVYADTQNSIDFNLEVAESNGISLEIPVSSIDLDLSAPFSGSATGNKTFTIQVGSSNSSGYKLMMYGDSNLTRTTADSSGNYPVIKTLSTSCLTGCTIDSSSFNDNAWGYDIAVNGSLASPSYKPLSGMIQISSSASANQTLDQVVVNLGAKINGEQSPGLYTTTLNFIVVANADNYIMQDVSSWKSSLAINQAVRAMDIRDNKYYWVTMLETATTNPRGDTCPGNSSKKCQLWMTQNLDLDLNENTTLVHGTTDLGWTNLDSSNNWTEGAKVVDISATWTPNNPVTDNETGVTTNYGTTISFTPVASGNATVTGWTNSQTTPYSADPGDYYVYTSNTTDADTRYLSLSECTNAGHSKDDCYHYSAGNYYNFTAAVASNDTSASTANYTQMPNSICPAGWRLPTGLTGAASESDTTTGTTGVYSDYNYLLVQNGVAENYVGAGQDASYTTGNPSGLNLIRSNPLFFVRSSRVSGGALFSSGTYGYGWSSTVYSAGNGYALYFNSTNVYPAYNDNRSNSFSVRCIAR